MGRSGKGKIRTLKAAHSASLRASRVRHPARCFFGHIERPSRKVGPTNWGRVIFSLGNWGEEG